jgi:tetratricopeptide (TPR) repeat protein
MPFWPFKKLEPKVLSPEMLRTKLIEAVATGSESQLRKVCKTYKSQVSDHVEFLSRIPDGVSAEDGSADRHIQAIVTVAQCLVNDCGAPELWNTLRGDADSNPIERWQQWIGDLPQRMKVLQYDQLIPEAESFIEQAQSLKGAGARQYESFLYGRLGDLLFNSGRALDAIAPFNAAFDLCVQNGDAEGQLAYLENLFEVHRYTDDGMAVELAERVVDFRQQHSLAVDHVRRQLRVMKDGEPLCRIVCVRGEDEWEMNEVSEFGEGSYEFQFRRNRIGLQKTISLTALGNGLASAGRLSDALGKYQEAMEVDPYDPDPVYQSGMCLLELGAYDQAGEAFAEVEKLAPGWFHCRTDRWLAAGLEDGTISNEEFMVARILEDGGLDPKQASSAAEQAVEKFPNYAPLRLVCGDIWRDAGDNGRSIEAFRKGLDLCEEPDLESRLLVALASSLLADSPERPNLIDRVLDLEGSLVAKASARLLSFVDKHNQ